LIDRYYFSTMAYQGARGIVVESIRQMNEAFAPRPDLVLILSVSPKQAMTRLLHERGAGDLFEREEYLTQVAQLFCSFQGKDICHIDASLEREKVQEAIRAQVMRLLNNRVHG
jgi:dTMP kinase